MAALIVVAVLCADLAGLDCSHLALQPSASAHGGGSATDADARDCLCCSVAVAAAAPAFSVALAEGAASEMALTTVADGVLRLPYRPPLSLPRRPR